MLDAARTERNAGIQLAIDINARANRHATVVMKGIQIGLRAFVILFGQGGEMTQNAIERCLLSRISVPG